MLWMNSLLVVVSGNNRLPWWRREVVTTWSLTRSRQPLLILLEPLECGEYCLSAVYVCLSVRRSGGCVCVCVCLSVCLSGVCACACVCVCMCVCVCVCMGVCVYDYCNGSQSILYHNIVARSVPYLSVLKPGSYTRRSSNICQVV